MRTWLFNRLTNMSQLPASLLVPGKIISSGAADNPASPFMVVSFGVEQPSLGMPTSSKTQVIPWTCWVHDQPGSMLVIDDASIALKNHLPVLDSFMIGGLSVLEVRWTETGEDAFDDHFKTNCRPVRFAATTRR